MNYLFRFREKQFGRHKNIIMTFRELFPGLWSRECHELRLPFPGASLDLIGNKRFVSGYE